MSYFNYKDKKIYYKILGQGKPLMFLHGNTASSKMFEHILPLYQNDFQIILLDFLGNGKSERIEEFLHDLYYQEAKQVIKLIEYLKLKEVILVGTSGGAWVGINVALKRPDLITHVIADSFDGRKFHENFIDELIAERKKAVNDNAARQFYSWCQGDDWYEVIKQDTKALTMMVTLNIPLFCTTLEHLKVPLLLIASLQDSMIRQDIKAEYKQILQQVQIGTMSIFTSGDHPALLHNATMVSEVIKEFINNY